MSDPAPLEPCEPTAYGPCSDYATVADVIACGGDTGLELEPIVPEGGGEPTPSPDYELLVKALRWASRRVFMATGQMFFGCCEAKIRPPCRSACGCVIAQSCAACLAQDRVPVPFLPLREIVEISIAGETLDPSKYQGYSEGWIVRTDGELWPLDDDWWYIIRHGLDLPPEGVPLVAAYALELAKSCLPAGECSLGPGIRVVQRDGVEFAVAEPPEYRELLLTGYGPLDDWIQLLRGGHVIEPPRVYRPGSEAPAPILEPLP